MNLIKLRRNHRVLMLSCEVLTISYMPLRSVTTAIYLKLSVLLMVLETLCITHHWHCRSGAGLLEKEVVIEVRSTHT